MIDNLKESEAFEAWYRSANDGSGLYCESQWRGWKARAAIEADLDAVPVWAASRTMAQPTANRAQELHEKSSMPWNQAEKLALEEAGIGDAEIDELIGEASNTVFIGLLDKEDVRQFVRSILVHQPSAESDYQQVEQPIDPVNPRHPSMEPFECPVCGSSYFGPLWEGREHVGRYCKGWPSGNDRSYIPCNGKHEELFAQPKPANQQKD